MSKAVVLRERSWLQPRADEQERLDGQTREESPMFTWTHWPNSPCGRASAAAQASRPSSRKALKCVFIYPYRISSVGAGGGNCSCPKSCGSSHGLCLSEDGSALPSPLCAVPGIAEAGGVWAGRTDLTFLPEEFL